MYNNSSTLFDYPGFVLLDQNNDTLARETVGLFGIAAESFHILHIHAGAVMPQGFFNCSLHLWTNFYTVEACTFNLSIDLCPGGCVDLFPYITNFGAPIVSTDFTWLLQDNMGNNMANGTLNLGTLNTDRDTVCLQAGNYVLFMNCATSPGGSQHYGFFSSPLNNGQHQDTFVQGGEPNILTIPFYTPCIGLPEGVVDHPHDAALALVLRNDELDISRNDGPALGDLRLMDASGRILRTMRSAGAMATMNVGRMSDAVYWVIASGDGHVVAAATRWTPTGSTK